MAWYTTADARRDAERQQIAKGSARLPSPHCSTFCAAAETTAHPAEVVEMALAHTIPNKVEAAYRRGNLLAKRRQLMDEWADYVTADMARRPG